MKTHLTIIHVPKNEFSYSALLSQQKILPDKKKRNLRVLNAQTQLQTHQISYMRQPVSGRQMPGAEYQQILRD
jgi:hypothetical protein